MLSDELIALAERFEEYRDSGLTMAPEGVAHFATLFRVLAEQAEAIEQAEVPHNARVLAFPAFRSVRLARSGPAGACPRAGRRPDPGDAA